MSKIFQGKLVPTNTVLAGYAALVERFELEAPVRFPCCVSAGGVHGGRRRQEEWQIFDQRFLQADTLADHLTFALRHEAVDLLILKRLFQRLPAEEFESYIKEQPTGANARRVWFFYEWLTGTELELDNLSQGNYVLALDEKQYFTAAAINSPRHRIKNNMPGVPGFCPIFRKTDALVGYAEADWKDRARRIIGQINPAVVARAASFMLLADSQASYQIEGERPPRDRLERWMRAVAQAGRYPLSISELERLQSIVLADSRFVEPGLRREGGFIGTRDWEQNPIPEFVSAREDDIEELLDALIAASSQMTRGGVDPVLQAAALSFGFVFIHPFVDGNGRLHRYLMHHVLAEREFAPKGLVFPVSSVLLDKQEEYGERLKAFSGPLLEFIDWRPTERHNVQVINDTADLYRFGDYTEIAEFLYGAVARTIDIDLPREIAYLQSYDKAKTGIQDMFDMPERMISALILQIANNGGRLANRRRKKEYAALTDDEVASIEAVVNEAFDIGEAMDPTPSSEIDPMNP